MVQTTLLSRMLAVSALVILLPLAAAAQTGRIAGSVEDPTGGRIANAAVSLAGPVDRTATTDADGRFAFGDLPDGEYRLRVGPDGFAPTEQRVRLSNGATVSVAFRLVVRVAERIVVTASKTGERELQSTPLAVSVLSGEELRRSESRTVADLAGQSPSLTFSQTAGYGQLTIRGIGTNAVSHGRRPQLGRLRGRRLPRAPGDGARRFRGPRPRRGPARPAGHALRQERGRRRAQHPDEAAVRHLRGERADRRRQPGRAAGRGERERADRRGQAAGLGRAPAGRRGRVRARPRASRPPARRRGRPGGARQAAVRVEPARRPAPVGRRDASGPDAADVREGARRQAGVRRRQPAGPPRGPQRPSCRRAATSSTGRRPGSRSSSRRRCCSPA